MVSRRDYADVQKILIFDWDDTICPSSFVDRWKIEHISEAPRSFQKLFAEISRIAAKCLLEASKYGEVLIITNSDEGWVNFSCERYLPDLLPFLDKFRIVSARTNYEKFYPGQPLCWKAAAFAHEVNELFESFRSDDCDDMDTSCQSLESTDVSEESFSSGMDKEVSPQQHQAHREIISFGDSMEERTAVRIVCEQLSATPKSVMFIHSPTPIQIIGQLQMLTNHMKFVCDNDSSLDLEISPEQAQRCAEALIRRHKKQQQQHWSKETAVAGVSRKGSA